MQRSRQLVKFRKAWLRHRDMPVFEPGPIRGLTPEHQFLTELNVSLLSWTNTELKQFTKEMGVQRLKRDDNPYLWTAVQIITDTFDVWELGNGLECDPNLIEEVTMARRSTKKTAAEIEDTEDEETKPTRRRRAAPPKATTKAPPKPRGRKAQPKVVEEEDDLDLEDEEDEEPVKPKRGGKAKTKAKDTAKPRGAAKLETVYTEQYQPVWESLDDGVDTKIGISEDGRAFRGKKQLHVQEFLESRGRKKTTAQMAADAMVEDGTASASDALAVVSHLLNVGSLEAL